MHHFAAIGAENITGSSESATLKHRRSSIKRKSGRGGPESERGNALLIERERLRFVRREIEPPNW